MFQQETTMTINDSELFYRLCGDGPALLLLHGFFMSGAQWEPLIPELAEEFRLVIPDLRGHGRSTNPSYKFTHRQAALDMYALLDKLGIGRFRAIGFSTGAMTLLHMATQQPGRIEAMALFGGTHYFPEQARAGIRAMTYETAAPEFMEMLGGLHVGGEKQIRALFSQFRQFAETYDDMNFTPAYLSTITARTLIVHGDRDEFLPVSIPVEIYGSLPHATLWIVPNAGHTNLLESMSACVTASHKLPDVALGILKAAG